MLVKFVKFCIVGGTGAIITFSLTWFLTEKFGLWYMVSLVFATLVAMTSNFLFNNYWTFSVRQRTPDDADYEWFAFYHGNPIQKWWKQSIANLIWEWISDTSSLLDIGSGSSPIVGHYRHAHAIEINKEKVKFIQEKMPHVVYSSQDTKYYGDEQFNHVLCIEVLEHLIEPEHMVKEISRVLKINGDTVIATPDYGKWLWRIAELFTPYKDEHVYYFTKKRLERMCKKYNLIPIKYQYIATCDLVEHFRKVSDKEVYESAHN